MKQPPLRIKTPCPKRWDDMRGDGKRRFCEHCQLHVHNLSAMSAHEREQFEASSGGLLCIAYELRNDGSMVTPARWPWMRRPLERARWAVAALLATVVPF